jgi:hypothetical protein
MAGFHARQRFAPPTRSVGGNSNKARHAPQHSIRNGTALADRHSASGDEAVDLGFVWSSTAIEVRVGAYGQQLIARNGYTIHMSLDDCVLCAAFLREQELALFLEMTVRTERQLEVSAMTEDAQRVFKTENAGGSSELSEALSMELLARTLGARLHKTEMELAYFTGDGSTSKITDYSIVLDGRVVGVSVTRACKGWPPVAGSYTVQDSLRLLSKKLLGVNESSRHVSNADWTKQMLHVFVADASYMTVLNEAAALIPPALIANTVVLFTLCTGAHSADIFRPRADELGSAPPPQKKKIKPGLGWKSEAHIRHLLESDPCAIRNLCS